MRTFSFFNKRAMQEAENGTPPPGPSVFYVLPPIQFPPHELP